MNVRLYKNAPWLALLGGAALVIVLPAAPAFAASPCCTVVSVGPVDAIVVVRNLTSGRQTKVTVTDKALLKNLKAGQKIDLDARGHLVPPSAEPPDGLRTPAR